MRRRNFIKSAVPVALLPAAGTLSGYQSENNNKKPDTVPADIRQIWLQNLQTMSMPVLKNAAAGTLKQNMPYKTVPGNDWDRSNYSPLEAFGRLATGISPWLNSTAQVNKEEQALKSQIRTLFLQSVDAATQPGTTGMLNFDKGDQPLVDSAFLAQSVLRAPNLYAELSSTTRQNLINCLQSSRKITPYNNNWILFSAMVEAGIAALGGEGDYVRISLAMQLIHSWYKGDSMFGDGAHFHFDYYNSIVIIPFMYELTEFLHAQQPEKYREDLTRMTEIVQRHTEILERMIGHDGTFPPVGRSIIYRTGLFHLPSMAVWKQLLPPALSYPAMKSALHALVQKTLHAPNTYDAAGWLNIGLHGNQPQLAEKYICTGSLYMASVIFLPLALSPTHDYWSKAPEPHTAQIIWQNAPGTLHADKALRK